MFKKDEEKLYFDLEMKQKNFMLIQSLLDEGEFNEQIKHDKEQLVKNSGLNLSYEELDVYLHGSDLKLGVLANLERELNEISHQKVVDFDFNLFESYIHTFQNFLSNVGSIEFSLQEQYQLFSLYSILSEATAVFDSLSATGGKKDLLNTLQKDLSQVKLQLKELNQQYRLPFNRLKMNDNYLPLRPMNQLLIQLNKLFDQESYLL